MQPEAMLSADVKVMQVGRVCNAVARQLAQLAREEINLHSVDWVVMMLLLFNQINKALLDGRDRKSVV